MSNYSNAALVEQPYIGQLIVDCESKSLNMVVHILKEQNANFDNFVYTIYDITNNKVLKLYSHTKQYLSGFRHWSHE